MNELSSSGKCQRRLLGSALLMQRFSLTVAPAIAACALLFPSVARAQSRADAADPTTLAARAAPPPATAWDAFGMRGIELELGGGIQTGGGNSPVQAATLWPTTSGSNGFPRGTLLDPTTASAIGQGFTPYTFDPFAISARVGYRLRHDLSVGVFFSFAQYLVLDGADTGDAPDSTSQLQRQQVTVGAYARYYFVHFHRRFQPWVSAGVGFNYDVAAYTRPIGSASGAIGAQPETGNYLLQQEGVVVPLAIGLDWRLAPVFSIGPTVGFSHVFALKGCVEVDEDQYQQAQTPAQNTCQSPPVQSFGYENFYAGIYAKVTFYPLTR
jgi:opacity protein-like surface antigen